MMLAEWISGLIANNFILAMTFVLMGDFAAFRIARQHQIVQFWAG
jgi:hypothetical protein